MVENKCMENKNTTEEEAQYFKFEPNECFVKFIPGEPVGWIKPFGEEEFETDAATEISDLPDGIYAQVAVYSDHFSHLSVMRKVLLRMTSWMHYLYLDH